MQGTNEMIGPHRSVPSGYRNRWPFNFVVRIVGSFCGTSSPMTWSLAIVSQDDCRQSSIPPSRSKPQPTRYQMKIPLLVAVFANFIQSTIGYSASAPSLQSSPSTQNARIVLLKDISSKFSGDEAVAPAIDMTRPKAIWNVLRP